MNKSTWIVFFSVSGIVAFILFLGFLTSLGSRKPIMRQVVAECPGKSYNLVLSRGQFYLDDKRIRLSENCSVIYGDIIEVND